MTYMLCVAYDGGLNEDADKFIIDTVMKLSPAGTENGDRGSGLGQRDIEFYCEEHFPVEAIRKALLEGGARQYGINVCDEYTDDDPVVED